MSKAVKLVAVSPADQEKACVLASLVLNDSGTEVTEQSIRDVVESAGLKTQLIYPRIIAGYLKKNDLSTLFSKFGAAGAASSGGSSDAPAQKAESGGDGKQAAAKVEEEEEAADFGMDLF